MSFSASPITLNGWETAKGRYTDFPTNRDFSRCVFRVIPMDEWYYDPFYERKVGPCKRYLQAESDITLGGKLEVVEMCPEERLHLLADVMEEIVNNKKPKDYSDANKKYLTEDDWFGLKEQRLRAGWEVGDVASFLGISEHKVNQVESGKKRTILFDLWEEWCSIPYGG